MSSRPQDLFIRSQAEDAVVRLFVATDERDWPTVESCFTDPFIFDMTSVTGGEPVSMTPRQVADAWAEGLKAIDHVHHQVGNFRTKVQGDRAEVRCYGIAFHHRTHVAAAIKSRSFVGTYEFDLVAQSGAWRISRFRFILKFVDGNLALESAT